MRLALVLAIACGSAPPPATTGAVVSHTPEDDRRSEAGLVRLGQIVEELCRCYAFGMPCEEAHDEEHAAEAWLVEHEIGARERRELLEKQLAACASAVTPDP